MLRPLARSRPARGPRERPLGSAAERALRVHVERVEGLAGRHEQAVAPSRRRSRRLAHRSGRRMWPIGSPAGLKMRTPSSSSSPMPQPHHRLPSISQRKPSGVPGPASMNTCRLASLLAVVDVEHDRMRRLASRAIRRRRASSHRARRQARSGPWISSATTRRLSPSRRRRGRRCAAAPARWLSALVIAEQPEGRIGEPDRAVGFHHHVVRRIELLALVAVGEHGDRAVILGARSRAARHARR